jgi:hypothetical protein
MNTKELSRYSDGLQVGWPGFDSWQGEDIYLLYSLQTGSEAYTASYAMGTGTDFSGGKGAGA